MLPRSDLQSIGHCIALLGPFSSFVSGTERCLRCTVIAIVFFTHVHSFSIHYTRIRPMFPKFNADLRRAKVSDEGLPSLSTPNGVTRACFSMYTLPPGRH